MSRSNSFHNSSYGAAARVIALLLVLALTGACAQAHTKGTRRLTGPRLDVPRAIVVYDFEPTASELGLGAGMPGEEMDEDEAKMRREAGKVIADVLAAELEDRGIVTSRQSGPVRVPPMSMAIGGNVVVMNEGSRAKRIFIGFGSGKSTLSSIAQLYGHSETGAILLWDFQNTAASGSKPGVLTTLPIGMAIQGLTAVVLIINGTSMSLGELSSTSSANAKRMAKEMADSVENALGRVTR